MTAHKRRKPRPPLDVNSLDELALHYVGRFATTRAKLRAYLTRKVRERGWDGSSLPDAEAIAERFAAQGYIDDCAYALGKSRSLTGRGYGRARVVQSLRLAGIDEQDGEDARAHAAEQAVAAALRFAERRRLGPFAANPARDPKARERALAAMIRAGHGLAMARTVLDLDPRAEIDLDELAEELGQVRS